MPVSPVTIGSTHAGGYGMHAHCLSCHNVSKLDLPAFIDRYGADTPWKILPLKCKACGSRQFSVTLYQLDAPDWSEPVR